MEFDEIQKLVYGYKKLDEKMVDMSRLEEDLFQLTHAGKPVKNITYREAFGDKLTPEEEKAQKKINQMKYHYAFAAREELKTRTPDSPFFINENKLKSKLNICKFFIPLALRVCLLGVLAGGIAIATITMGIGALPPGIILAIIAWTLLAPTFVYIRKSLTSRIYKNMDEYMPEIRNLSETKYMNREPAIQQLEQYKKEGEQINDEIFDAKKKIRELFESLFGTYSNYYELDNFMKIEEDLRKYGLDFVRGKLNIERKAQDAATLRYSIECTSKSIDRLISRSVNPDKWGYISDTGEIKRY